ncbi:hypothetical protein LOZ64_000279 [Ophidiomyces ophidiicola]|nr:hypothetical protein LOZ64_000279 [Ophidiomyces ophidiicola]KAI2014925.1 hypothetical protein LOZ49_001013 [Ophidiomyces ophidiicola]KAI2026354.1 hypothetical protein LOZ46_000345 [Ophidiomyces ophidiicola]KAI2145313.1 hypothetical protein LOZ29_000477 [Ophidiomyces ophidiicola]KAI2455493.1 vacuolar protein sorting-associated protein 1 [Ophidiomyces ophidiicola]
MPANRCDVYEKAEGYEDRIWGFEFHYRKLEELWRMTTRLLASCHTAPERVSREKRTTRFLRQIVGNKPTEVDEKRGFASIGGSAYSAGSLENQTEGLLENFDLADEASSNQPASAGSGRSNPRSNPHSAVGLSSSTNPPSPLQHTAEDLLNLLRPSSESTATRINRLRRRREPSAERPDPPDSLPRSNGSGYSGGSHHASQDSLLYQTSHSLENERPLTKRRRLADNMKPDGAASTSNTNGYSPITNGATSASKKAAMSNILNGRSPHSPAQFQTNGTSDPSSSPTYYGHSREEVTRILIQSLYDLGYPDAATTLCRESKYELESGAVAAFRSCVVDGEWAEAERILLESLYEDEKSMANGKQRSGNHGLVLAKDADKNEMLFCLRQQRFLELLDRRDLATALMVLRNELTPLNHDISRLHALSSLLMCPPEDLRAQAGLEASVISSRQKLLDVLSKSISPSVMIPQHRLAALLDQVKQGQINRCLYHNTAETPSLYSDHMCDRAQFPREAVTELSHHTDEVWYLEFSHDGTKLATASRDRSVIIYDAKTFNLLHRLEDHTGPVAFTTWSPDDTKLISCCQDYRARLWDADTGRCILTINHHHEPVTSAAWAPDGETFVTCSLDQQSQLCLWDTQGTALYTWPGSSRIRDCAISPDGKRLIAISIERRIHVYNFQTREEEYSILLKLDLTCINITRDSRYMLVNMSEGEIQLLDIETTDVVRQYSGQKQAKFIIRGSFGGAAENFIVSGSEDSKIYIWHKENSTLVETLEGHSSGCVNAVAWNPKDSGMFASAGDDRKVKM